MRNTITRNTRYDELPEYLTPEECRAYLGLGRTSLYAMLRERKIHHKRYGRTIRIPKTALRVDVP